MQEDASPIHLSPSRNVLAPPSQVGPAPLMFGDDLMLDFGSGGASAVEGGWNSDQMVMQDTHDFPW